MEADCAILLTFANMCYLVNIFRLVCPRYAVRLESLVMVKAFIAVLHKLGFGFSIMMLGVHFPSVNFI